VLQDNVLDSGLSFPAGDQQPGQPAGVGLEHIDEFGFEHIEVGNNAVDVIESVVDGISAFRDACARRKRREESDADSDSGQNIIRAVFNSMRGTTTSLNVRGFDAWSM